MGNHLSADRSDAEVFKERVWRSSGRARSLCGVLVQKTIECLKEHARLSERSLQQEVKALLERAAEILIMREARRLLHRKDPPIDDLELHKIKGEGARFVVPRLVSEVEHLRMTSAGKLRAPSYKGLRPDKEPEDGILDASGDIALGCASVRLCRWSFTADRKHGLVFMR